MLLPLCQFILYLERTWPPAQLEDPLHRLILRWLRGCHVRVQELHAMNEIFPPTAIDQLQWQKPLITIDETAWYQSNLEFHE